MQRGRYGRTTDRMPGVNMSLTVPCKSQPEGFRGVRYGIALATMLMTSNVVMAGPYARLAAGVQANGGQLDVNSDGTLESQSPPQLNAMARQLCHVIALEGVTVTTVNVLTESGALILAVTGAPLVGC